MCNGTPVFVIADFEDHGNSEFQHSKIFIDKASTYFTINCKRHQYAHGFMLIKLILEARKAKIDWL